MTFIPELSPARWRVLIVVGVAAALSILALDASAAPRGTDEWLTCDMGGDVIIDDENNGCCTDEDQDGYIDTCWVCDENHENCVSEELGEDLRAQSPGIGGATSGPQAGSQSGSGLPGRSTIAPGTVQQLQLQPLAN